MHEVLSSKNLFLDSSDGVGSGDNFTLELSQDSITAEDGQQLKLTLMNFNMYTNFYHAEALVPQHQLANARGLLGGLLLLGLGGRLLEDATHHKAAHDLLDLDRGALEVGHLPKQPG